MRGFAAPGKGAGGRSIDRDTVSILSIQSQVAFGHVGNSAATLPLQRMGYEVWGVPTVLFSNHPAHGQRGGRAVETGVMRDIIAGLDSLGALGRCAAVLSGYLGSADAAGIVSDAVRLVRARNERALYLCDPAFAHEDGLFVEQEVADAVRHFLIPAAGIVTPNPFELAYLTSTPVTSRDGALAACRALCRLGPAIAICTSVPLGKDTVGTLAVSGGEAWLVETPKLAGPLHGAGDLFSALFLGYTLNGSDLPSALGAAVSGTFGVLSATGTAPDLALVAAQDEVVSPSVVFQSQKIG